MGVIWGWAGGREREVRLNMCKVYNRNHDQDYFDKFGQSFLGIPTPTRSHTHYHWAEFNSYRATMQN